MSQNSASAGLIVKPVTFVAGQQLPAASLNSDFDTIYTGFNGNITSANIAANAAIPLTKIDLNSEAFNLQLAGNHAWAAGVTGDSEPRVSLDTDGYVVFGPGGGTAVDIGLQRSGVNTLRLFVPGGGTPTLNLNSGTLSGVGALSAASLTLTVTPLAPASGGLGIGTTPTNGQIPIGNGTNYTAATLTAGAKIAITNGSGSITVATTGAAASGANSDITSLSGLLTPLSVAQGGTGAASAGAARTALGAAAAGANNDITSLSALSTPISVAQGGTAITSYTAGDLITATGATTLSKLAKGTANQVVGMNNGATTQEYKTIAAGSNITVTHGANSITIAAPTSNGNVQVLSLAETITANSTDTIGYSFTAGLVMRQVLTSLVCTSANLNYSVGDKVEWQGTTGLGGGTGMSVAWDTSNVYLIFPAGVTFYVYNKTTRTIAAIDNTKWAVQVVLIGG